MANPDLGQRDRVVDAVRAGALVVVVAGHWLMAAIGTESTGDGAYRLQISNMLELRPWTQWLTWVLQVMPLFFIVGGFANAVSWQRTQHEGGRWADWIATRLLRAEGAGPTLVVSPLLALMRNQVAAARKAAHAGHGDKEAYNYFLAVVFPHNQMQILPYNRVLKDLNGLSPAQLREKLASVFTFQHPGVATPARKHTLGFYLEGEWHGLHFLPPYTAVADPIERLDVTLLQKQVLAPIFDIHDPRTSERINFVGGIRGTAELEKLVNRGEYACAFSLFPTSIEDLMTIADAGGIMPPKSTWFEPKLRDAMFCHMI